MLVVYAEDDIEDYSFFTEVMELIDPQIDCMNAIDGAQVMKFLEESDVLPDYIFLDVNMPTMDGKACLKAIKTDPHFINIPTIIYTTAPNSLDQELCMQLGAAYYLPKPYSVNEAKASIQKIFNHHKY
jgi:CheY-like chemotaxis protein